MDPKISIVIPFYNCPYIDQAIQSAINQNYSNYEIIVVDDGSTQFTEKIDPFRHHIRYFKKENGGTATALNYGIQKAVGEYISWLSSDDFYHHDKLSKQADFMLKHQADVSFTNFDAINEDNIVIYPFAARRFLNFEEVYLAFKNGGNPVNSCTVIIKKSIFDKVGYFNPNFLYTQDFDMWFRILLNGYTMYYLDEVLIKYRIHQGSGSSKHYAEMLNECSTLLSIYPQLLNKF